jgi:hypothetical protein
MFADSEAAKAAVDQAAARLGADGQRFLVGGQRGVDTWAALAALALGVPFTLYLPLEPDDFAAAWSADDRRLLDRTLTSAVEVHVVGGAPERAYTERNRLLATSGDLLVAVWTGISTGGTAETIRFARAAGTPIQEVLLQARPGADAARGRGL